MTSFGCRTTFILFCSVMLLINFLLFVHLLDRSSTSCIFLRCGAPVREIELWWQWYFHAIKPGKSRQSLVWQWMFNYYGRPTKQLLKTNLFFVGKMLLLVEIKMGEEPFLFVVSCFFNIYVIVFMFYFDLFCFLFSYVLVFITILEKKI